ncbi:hypothetical protein QBC39DRAFT_415884 [Podospora conica]|nr:hypothetical protein QBC39DRAFT_415884 [Schizothecium conicum]
MKLTTLAAFFGAALALPSARPSARACTNPTVRKEWRNATVSDRLAYLSAAVCITKSPPRVGYHPNATLQDEFAFIHAILSNTDTPIHIHGVPAFLPWHRFFLRVYEDALHDCGYTGPALYWDFVHDAPAPSRSPIWDPVTGFGGNGAEPNSNPSGPFGPHGPRVVDGPFKDYRPLYFGQAVSPHDLSRNWVPADPFEGGAEMVGGNYNATVMERVFAETTFAGFRASLEVPHNDVHTGVGGGPGSEGGLGDLGANTASPNDPVFFLLHGGVDRLWWLWQQQNPSAEYDGVDQNNRSVTVDDVLPMMGLAEDGVVADYLDVNSPGLCYTYE